MTLAFQLGRNRLCETNRLGGSIAIDPEVIEEGIIEYATLERVRSSTLAQILIDEADRLEWLDERGRRHWLRPLTLESYRARIRRRYNLDDFSSFEELESAIRAALRLVQ